ncbi:type I methionyl aminopeptidase [Aerococcaceae bacterium NML210727]|nr:type I methionyl aminopeptidase [Aerococcaceae bacterium NML210727]MCW6655207.1 type I methionyl aminopeptidase [Aerococcaceae bacterium NML201296]MCW6667258.1 type I methionyl aminopeptidase [Aerococcaceae bacterium NML190938]MCW6674455.1 type I methionyl aminopeptidase [Aerococcaceae bacterium NML171108]MCW6677066.1 type I methionyl aminopeptidase [Aerococcaceae bacterium NML180378]MCW6681029.1 type I methionyl aminopeptidase [Aerococcaceae bacterium NML130460]MCW6682115.1 type I methion
MITLKSEREIQAMMDSGKILAGIHVQLRDFIKPGITTKQIDKFVQERIEKAGAVAAQIGYEGYQFATCTSVNDEICHGFPSNYTLKSGDIVKVDFCVDLNGAISDSCWCYAVGTIDEKHQELMEVTKEALYKGIEQAVVGNRIGDIGAAIQEYAESKGYGVVRDFIGHGIGPTIHEDPQVPHYGIKGKGLRLKEGMTITIEPMITTGTWKMKMDENGWTARTLDGGFCAQYEHSLAITKDGPIIMTAQENAE